MSDHVEVLRHMKETLKTIMRHSEVAALDAAIAALSSVNDNAVDVNGSGDVDDKTEWEIVPRELLSEARNVAMEWTVRGRVPECGKFGEIAQDLDAMLAAAPTPAVDGCHCATCTCSPGMTPSVRFDLSPAQQEGAVRDHLIRMGWTPPADAQSPSAPVWVDGLAALADRINHRLEESTMPVGCALVRSWEADLRRALAQQPAADCPRCGCIQGNECLCQPATVECPHRTRCDCLAACKYGYAGDGALASQPGGSE